MSSAAPRSTPHLDRALGPWMATAIVVGTVIGSGIFKKPQSVAERVPEFGPTLLIWTLGGLLALLGALALAEIAVRFPKAGGNYVYLRQGYGNWAGFLWGWVEFWIIKAASMAALATIFTESLHEVLKQVRSVTDGQEVLTFWPRVMLTVSVILALGMVNVRGVTWGGWLQLILTTIKVGTLLAIPVLPFVLWGLSSTPTEVPRSDYLSPWWPQAGSAISWGAIGAALVGVLWAYHGWMNLAPVAEEVERPGRNIPLALITGVLILTGLYVSVNVAYYLVLPRSDIVASSDTTVAATFSLRLLGPMGAAIASAAVMISVFGALNGNLLAGPRLLFAMGRDGMAPRALERVHPRYHTPALAIMVMALWAAALVVVAGALTRYQLPAVTIGGQSWDLNLPPGKPLFDVITDFAMFGAISFETLAITTLFVFRWRDPTRGRNLPYRCWGYPIVPAAFVLVMGAVLVNMFREQRTEAMIGLGFIAIGAIVYRITLAKRSSIPE